MTQSLQSDGRGVFFAVYRDNRGKVTRVCGLWVCAGREAEEHGGAGGARLLQGGGRAPGKGNKYVG
jgi:hypothetical protein